MGRYPEVEALLDHYSGLDVQSVGRRTFERATESRFNQACDGSYEVYLRQLKSDEAELERLLELLLVPETWFFRDDGTFNFLSAFVKGEWRKKNDRAVLQILSAPCSTGEEPYSIAIKLLESGLTPSQFRIQAADISSRALAIAQAGLYPNASFRSRLTPRQTQFFESSEDRTAVCESVRSSVTFIQGNLVDPNFMAGSARTFDVIFCKNLMIYLGQAGRARVMANLRRLLKEGGLLFVGHSEVALFHKAGYAPVSSAKAFGLTNVKKPADPAAADHRRRTARARLGDNHRPTTSAAHLHPVETLERPSPRIPTPSRLETARNLADRGDLEEAARLCRSLISEDSMHVDAYYLAGLIEQSQDRLAQAEDLFSKAIYLDPEHYETLVQLCLLAQKRGDSAKAAQYRRRMRRLDGAAQRG
jgi:chemotaxis protein methyltransferase WspC